MRGTGGGTDDADDGIYVGVAGHYYMVALRARQGRRDSLRATRSSGTRRSDSGRHAVHLQQALCRGVGGDAGIAWITGRSRWDSARTTSAPSSRVRHQGQRIHYNPATDSVTTTLLNNHVQSKTKLPVTYIANAAMRMGTGTTVGGDVVNSGGEPPSTWASNSARGVRGTGGISRDQRKRVQFGWGGGLRLGPFGLDVGFWTHSNSLSPQRAITMATSISVY